MPFSLPCACSFPRHLDYVKPAEPVFSYLPALTGLSRELIEEQVSVETASMNERGKGINEGINGGVNGGVNGGMGNQWGINGEINGGVNGGMGNQWGNQWLNRE